MIRRKNKPPTKSAVDYIELLYNKYAPKLKYVAKQYIHNDTLAEDFSQTSVLGISHPMFFLCICKDPLYGFFSLFISFFHPGCMTDIFDLLHVVFSHMTRNYLYVILTVCAAVPVWTVLANKPVTFILSIAFTVCCGVMKHSVIRTQITVKEFIIYIIIFLEITGFAHRSFVWHDWNFSVFYQLPGDRWYLISRIHHVIHAIFPVLLLTSV